MSEVELEKEASGSFADFICEKDKKFSRGAEFLVGLTDHCCVQKYTKNLYVNKFVIFILKIFL